MRRANPARRAAKVIGAGYTPRARTPAPAAGLLSALPVETVTMRVMPKPKSPRHESEAWRRAVASLPCQRCGVDGRTQCAHRNEGKGMSLKTDDALTAALCVECHTEIDRGKHMSRDKRRTELDAAILRTVAEMARRGLIRAKEVA